MFECTIICKSLQSPLLDTPKKKPNKDDKKDPDGFQKPKNVVNVIFGGDPSFSKRVQKLLLREILSVEPAIQRPLKYSEVPITFSREDQWTSFSEPGKFPLVLDPVIQGSKLTRVLIDGGSGLNLIFASTLRKMGLNYLTLLTPSKAPFYSIVPVNSSTPIGSVTLPVTFGTEHIKFEVTDFESSYHAILGRPVLAKFMVMPHYVYLLLKMPGTTGVLSLCGDLLKSFECDKEAIVHASSIRVPSSVSEIFSAAKELSLEKDSISKKPSQLSVKLAGDVGTKTIQLQEGDDSKTTIIREGLSDK